MSYQLTEDEQNVIDEGLTFLEERDYPLAAGLLRRVVKHCVANGGPSFQPDRASPPGATIKMILDDRHGGDIQWLGEQLGLSVEGIEHLLVGRLTIDDDLALCLATSTKTPRNFWIERERNYRAHLLRLDQGYVPQEVAAECLKLLSDALGGPPPGQPNTLVDMVKAVCGTRGRREELLREALKLLDVDGSEGVDELRETIEAIYEELGDDEA